MTNVTQILNQIEQGDPAASEELLPLVYEELRVLARQRLANEKPGQTLQATALVHEAYVRLVKKSDEQSWDHRGHFFAAAAEAMRRIVIEIARRKKGPRQGGHLERVSIKDYEPAIAGFDLDLLSLNEALQQLEAKDERKASLVKLRFFAGLTHEEAAHALGISTSTADDDWAYAKAWLRIRLGQ